MTTVFDRIVLIDDDSINNHLNTLFIRRYLKPITIEIISFTDPQTGFQYITEDSIGLPDTATLLMLDINMPVLSGWALLAKMKEFNQLVLPHMTVYVLSSSVDPDDIHRANSHPLVEGFISKPLNTYLPQLLGETLKAKQKEDRLISTARATD